MIVASFVTLLNDLYDYIKIPSADRSMKTNVFRTKKPAEGEKHEAES
jgi:hypothetical protein